MRTSQAQKVTADLLDMPDPKTQTPAQKPRQRRTSEVRRAATEVLPTRRERPGAQADPYADPDTHEFLRARGRKRIRRGLIPQSKYGRIAAGVGMLAFLGGIAAASYFAVHFLHHDPQFIIPSSSAIELQGNQHLTRSQLLSVFGEDVERNIFDVPLAERREQLEQIPWVEHATIMRLLPNHVRVQVVERTPIAFVRQGGTIGMADASGVLLDIPPDAPGNPNYSFPVVTGLKAEDTAESREQRMHLYAAFLKDLDSGGKKISSELSEVDLSDPEDVKALLPSNNQETMVHFGTEHFLARYNRFQEHIAEWRQQYPRLSSVDMRYERQVVLQMPQRDPAAATVPGGDAGSATAKTTASSPTAARPEQAHVASAQKFADPRPVTPKAPAVVHAPVIARPEHKELAVKEPARNLHRPEPHAIARPIKKESAKQADMARRVEAIKAWMAKRQAAREAGRAQ